MKQASSIAVQAIRVLIQAIRSPPRKLDQACPDRVILNASGRIRAAGRDQVLRRAPLPVGLPAEFKIESHHRDLKVTAAIPAEDLDHPGARSALGIPFSCLYHLTILLIVPGLYRNHRKKQSTLVEAPYGESFK